MEESRLEAQETGDQAYQEVNSDILVNLKTISRLFHGVAFKNEDTRISEKTLQLSGQYIRLFINEAIMRANEQRISEGLSLNRVDGIDNIQQHGEREDPEEELPDVTLNEDDIASNPNTQFVSGEEEVGNDTLDARHLSKVAGVLLLDF